MCLYNTDRNYSTPEPVKNGMCAGYKSIDKTTDHRPAVELQSPFYKKIWRPGWNKDKKQNIKSKNSSRGFHVFLTRRAAQEYRFISKRTLRVYFYPKDIKGIGKTYMRGEEKKTVTVTKCFVYKKDYEEALARPCQKY